MFMKSEIKIGVIQFPGSNTERETFMACDRVGLKPIEFLWNDDPSKLSGLDGYIIVGGFSYEDRSRAGVIAALDPIMEQIALESEKGKPILGICNGAQILVESGLVPGLKNNQVGIALTDNKRVKDGLVVGVGYYNTWTNLKTSVPSKRCAFTRSIKKDEIIKIPLAHGEGRFVMPSSLLENIISNEQHVYQYCDQNGDILDEFPTNPNGSAHNLAAVCNPKGNVMAMMPHPERTENGDPIFSSMKEFIEMNNPVTQHFLTSDQSQIELTDYAVNSSYTQWMVNLVITDNEASSVQRVLKQLGYDVSLTRQTHWEMKITGNDSEVLDEIESSGELFNSNKEFIGELESNENTVSILVHQKEDMYGRLKHESLRDRFQIKGLEKLKKGVVWNLSLKRGNINNVINEILKTNILFNPISHECHRIN
tara:strand:- start:3646 stop:4917 length:1272 start_codon:yes stop_codon:yes gene_type:complete